MNIQRPDLSNVEPDIRAYIEALEAKLAEQQATPERSKSAASADLEPDEPPTTLNVITASRSGQAKRTPRHLYSRQRRGGMGVFDLDTADDDPPAHLLIADESQDLLLVTTQGRVFRRPVADLPEAAVRSRGQSLLEGLPLAEDESLAVLLPHRSEGYLCLLTDTGQVRRLRHHFVGYNMEPGVLLFDVRTLGRPAAGCWSSGQEDLFVATRQGRAIRFSEDLVPLKGCQAIRLSDDDAVAGLSAVPETGGVFLLTADGQGTIRLMSGFSANKAPGGGGKIALKTDHLVGAVAVTEAEDIFIISRLSKIIRFQAEEVPPKEGVVQGVNCMTLRADETVAVTGNG